ncbi:MAG: hypothetical protein ACRDHZ_02770 [Ktedonobacteraceae bacterium]
MSNIHLHDLQASVRDTLAFTTLTDYITLCQTLLELLEETQPTRIISPAHHSYIFYQYGQEFDYKITHPLNTATRTNSRFPAIFNPRYLDTIPTKRIANTSQKETFSSTIALLPLATFLASTQHPLKHISYKEHVFLHN